MITLPYVLPMLLGMSYDYNKASVGESIFSKDTVDAHTVWTDNPNIDYKFKMISSTGDATDVLDVTAELSLKVMADLVNIEGSGSYLKKTDDRSKTVEILCHLKFQTGSERLASEAPPRSGWEGNIGTNTHFARTITYGGELVASLKFTAVGSGNVENLQAALRASVGIEGTLDATVAGKLKKVAEESTDSMTLSISYYATTPVAGIAQDLDSFTSLIGRFADDTKQVNNGRGNPIRMELVPLRSLQGGSSLPTFIKNAALTSKMSELSDRYSDLLVARGELYAWASKLETIPDASIQKISDFSTKLESIIQVFYVSVNNLDVRSEASATQFDAAANAYVDGGFNIPNKYTREYQNLREDVERDMKLLVDCFSVPLHNVGMLRGNLVDIGESFRAEGPQSVQTCKTTCMANDECLSITFVKGSGALTTEIDARNTCHINKVSMSADALFPVPLEIGTSVDIYTRIPNCPEA